MQPAAIMPATGGSKGFTNDKCRRIKTEIRPGPALACRCLPEGVGFRHLMFSSCEDRLEMKLADPMGAIASLLQQMREQRLVSGKRHAIMGQPMVACHLA